MTGSEKSKAEGSDVIDQYLDNSEFLSFLEKNSDSREHAGDDAYLKEKIALYTSLGTVKESVKKFVAVESGSNNVDVADKSFVDSLEGLAVRNPVEFLSFCGQVTKYIDSLKKFESLNALNDTRSKEIVGKEKEFDTQEDERSLKSYISFLKEGRKYTREVNKLRTDITELKKARVSDEVQILNIRSTINSLKSELKSNEAFQMLEVALLEKIKSRISSAITKGEHANLMKENIALANRNKESLFSDKGYDELISEIREHAKSSIDASTEGLVNKSETIRLSIFDKGVIEMQKKGKELGLNEDECNKQIVAVLEKKIETLETDKEPQATIKIILAKRIIRKLTS